MNKNATKYDIKFKKTERVCGRNEAIRAGESGKLIYDYQVLVNGEHRADWCPLIYNRGYELRIPDHQDAIQTKPGERYSSVKTAAQALFPTIIQNLLDQGLLPTLEQLKQAQKDRELKEADAIAKEKERVRIAIIKEAGPQLLEALTALLQDWKARIIDQPCSDDRTVDFGTYHVALKAQQAINVATRSVEAEEGSQPIS
jgi:hypothetical protein